MAKDTKMTGLRAELSELLEQVDREGLEFLVRQARTIVHNLEVDRVNSEIQRLGHQAEVMSTEERDGSPPARPPAHVEVSIQENQGRNSFVLIVGGQRKIFSLEEMRSLARICHDAAEPEEGADRLYRWFDRNRTDVFVDCGIGNAGHPALPLIHSAIRERYRPKAD